MLVPHFCAWRVPLSSSRSVFSEVCVQQGRLSSFLQKLPIAITLGGRSSHLTLFLWPLTLSGRIWLSSACLPVVWVLPLASALGVEGKNSDGGRDPPPNPWSFWMARVGRLCDTSSPLGVRGHRGLRLHQREWSSEWSRGMSKTRQRIRQGTGSEPVRIHSLHLSMGETTLSLPSPLTCTH